MKSILLGLLLCTASVAEITNCQTKPSYGVCLKALANAVIDIRYAENFCIAHSHHLACNKTPAHGMCVMTVVESLDVDLVKAEKICLGIVPEL